jgi:hypothetical protein
MYLRVCVAQANSLQDCLVSSTRQTNQLTNVYLTAYRAGVKASG